MAIPSETPHGSADPLTLGHFNEHEGYSAWRTRGTDDYLLFCTLDGKGRIGTDRGDLVASRGDFVLISPGTRHDYGVEQKLRHWEFLFSHFRPRPHWVPWLRWPEVGAGVMRLSLHDPAAFRKIAAVFKRSHELAAGARAYRLEWAAHALEEVLLLLDEHNPRSTPQRLDARVQAAMEYISRSLRQPLGIRQIAGRVGLSDSRLSHLFRQHAGQTVQDFIEQQRMSRARQLLELTNRTVATVAYDCGYENPFYFTLRFKKRTGQSPRAYRAGFRGIG